MIFGKITSYFKQIEALNAEYYSTPYDVISKKSIFERIALYNFSFETAMLLVIALMFLIFHFGKNQNTKITNAILLPINNAMYLEFGNIGFNYRMKKVPYITEHQNTLITSFFSGRKHVESMEIKIHLSSRYNPLGLLMERLMKTVLSGVMEDNVEEFVEITIKPNNVSESAKVSNAAGDLFPAQTRSTLPKKYQFVSGIVSKHSMTSSRNNYYYLRTVPMIETPRLPQEYVFMTENNTLSNGIFFKNQQDNERLNEVLDNCKWFLKSFTITDLPDEQPILDTDFDKSSSRIHIVLKLPKNQKDVDHLIELIQYALSIYDDFAAGEFDKIFMNPNLLKKIDSLRAHEKSNVLKIMKDVEVEMKKKELEDKKQQETK
ncbi:hypothetical protein ACO0SA_003527 [Hanseniaspora valbyensis]